MLLFAEVQDGLSQRRLCPKDFAWDQEHLTLSSGMQQWYLGYPSPITICLVPLSSSPALQLRGHPSRRAPILSWPPCRPLVPTGSIPTSPSVIPNACTLSWGWQGLHCSGRVIQSIPTPPPSESPFPLSLPVAKGDDPAVLAQSPVQPHSRRQNGCSCLTPALQSQGEERCPPKNPLPTKPCWMMEISPSLLTCLHQSLL